MTPTTSSGALTAAVLRAAGVDGVYGEPLAGLSVVPAPPSVAALLAHAHERVFGRPAVVTSADGGLRSAPTPGAPTRAGQTVDRAADLVEHLGALARGTAALRLAFDPDEPAPEIGIDPPPPPPRWAAPSPDTIDRLTGAAAPVVLAGPGVVHAGAVSGLHALAVAGSFGVLNTWGAKGVFHWQSRHHWATGGLQARDFELGGLADTDLIVATGLDPLESPDDRWQLAPSITIDPLALAPLAEALQRPWRALTMPPLRDRLAAATQAGWASTGMPIAPSRATRNYGEAIGPGGMLAADPGIAGFWVARTYSTTELGRVHVPADADAHGFAPACVLVARLRQPDRPALAVIDGPPHHTVVEVLDVAASLGVAVPVEAWAPDGRLLTSDRHRLRIARLAYGNEHLTVSLAVGDQQMAAMLDAAGPVIAWQHD